MRAILVDPIAKTVTEVDCSGHIHDVDGVPGIYTLTDVNILTVVMLTHRNLETMYLDDEGLLKENHFFLFGEYPQPLAGKGLILGTDDSGDCAPSALSVEYVKSRVAFLGGPQDMSHLATFEIYSF